MTPDDIDFLEWIFKGAVTIIFMVGGWLWAMLIRTVSKVRDDLAEHKLSVSENYAKKIELNPIYQKLDDIQGDIKQLLGRKQERDS